METGIIIVLFLELAMILAVARTTSNNDEQIKTVEAQLKWQGSQNLKEIKTLERQIVLKDEKINELEGAVSKLTWDYNLQVDSCKCGKETRNDSSIAIRPVRPECLGEGAIINNYGSHTEEVDCPRCAVPTGFSGNGED